MGIKSTHEKSSVLIFGGLGFIGSRLATSLSNMHTVYVIDNCLLTTNSSEMQSELVSRRAELISKGVMVHDVDIFDDLDLKKMLSGDTLDTVYHMAGVSSVKSAYENDGYENIVGITQKVLGLLSQLTLKRIVYFSSSMVYGDFRSSRVSENHTKLPVDSYGTYKYASEALISGWCRQRNVVSIILRPTAVYGPNDVHQRVVSRFINQARENGAMTVFGDGESELDFTFVEDVVSVAKAAVGYQHSDEFNISFGQGRSLNELIKLIKIFYPQAETSFNFTPGYRTAKRGTLCSDKAMRQLGYEPKFSLEHGLLETFRIEGDENSENRLGVTEPSFSIPLSRPDLISSDFDNVSIALQSGWLTTGDQNRLFEKKCIEYLKPINPSHALTVNSCASALILALKASGISGEVIVPAFTFSATANAIELAGATPKFVDIEPHTLGIDPQKLGAAISEKTQAILVVHLAGVCCDIEAILTVARKRNLLVIEDCAQALGAEYNGIKAGSFGDIACFSFFPTKMITTGEGGMLVTSNEIVYERAKSLANHGYGSSTLDRENETKPWEREQLRAGYNFRMSNINAALGVAQMSRIESIVSSRRSKALYLIDLLKDIDEINVFEYQDRTSVYQAFNLTVSEHIERDYFVLALRDHRIMASVHYPDVLSNSNVFKKYSCSSGAYPVANNIAKNIVTLPMFGAITNLQLVYMAEKIEQVIDSIKLQDLKKVI